MLMLALIAALQAAPNGQLLGAGWVGERVDVHGQVIALDGDCWQVAVERQGIEGAGGRLWACDDRAHRPTLNQRAHVSGVVTYTRMTRMGPAWRVIPVVDLRH